MPQLRARAAPPPVTRAPPSWFCFVRKFLLFFFPPPVRGLTAWSRHNSLVIGELTECSKAPLLKCGATIGWNARSSRRRGSKWLLLAAAGAHVFGSQPCRRLPRVSLSASTPSLQTFFVCFFVSRDFFFCDQSRHCCSNRLYETIIV